jgi:multiple sugar transport system substrate-binding protein
MPAKTEVHKVIKTRRFQLALGAALALVLAGQAHAQTTINALFMAQAGYSETDVRAMTDAYLKTHPDVTVKLEFVPYETLHDKITLASGSSDGYDVVLFDVIWPAEFAVNNILTDVTSRIDPKTRDGLEAGAWTTVDYKGKSYGMPWSSDSKYLFYNKAILAKAGITAPPASWDDVKKDAEIIKQKNILQYPIVWSWSQNEAAICDYTVLMQAFSGKFLDADGKPAFQTGGGLDALNYMVDSLKSGISNPHSTEYLEEDARRVFSSGQAAFALNWTYMYDLANSSDKESQVTGQVGVMSPPGIPGKSTISTVNGAMGLGIPVASKNQDAAWNYIEYLTSAEVEAKYAGSSPSSWKSFYEDAKKTKGPNSDLIAAQDASLGALFARPQVPDYQQFSARLQQALQQAMLGKASAEDSLKSAAADLGSK